MSRILLVRHGESEWNALGRWQGQADPPLTDAGRSQAILAARALGQLDVIAASDLLRAHHTAELIAAELGVGPVHVDARLRERDAGEWSGLTRDEVHQGWPGYLADDPLHADRRPDDPPTEQRPPQWEADDSLVARTLPALDALAAAVGDGEILVVTHSGVIMALENLLGAPRVRVPNLGARWFEWHGPGRLQLGPRLALLDATVDQFPTDADAI